MICTDSAGDVDNARLSYQNALADEVGQLRPELWHFFMEFESCYGSIQDILAVESRWAALFPQEGFADTALASIDRLRRRYTHFDLWPCTLGQRDYLQRLLGPEEAALLEMCASAGWALLATFVCDAMLECSLGGFVSAGGIYGHCVSIVCVGGCWGGARYCLFLSHPKATQSCPLLQLALELTVPHICRDAS
jgi:hypothetical protein